MKSNWRINRRRPVIGDVELSRFAGVIDSHVVAPVWGGGLCAVRAGAVLGATGDGTILGAGLGAAPRTGEVSLLYRVSLLCC